jgi:hypothetical protein
MGTRTRPTRSSRCGSSYTIITAFSVLGITVSF